MLTKLILKLLFKATVPLIAVCGVLSYGIYMKGGDPMAMWSKVGNKMIGSIRQSGTQTAQSVKSLAPVGQFASAKNSVYSWVDANGMTHYGSTPPPGSNAREISIRSSSSATNTHAVNTQPPQSTAQSVKTSNQSASDEPLPGMAGVKLPMDIQPEDLGLNREEIMKLIKSQ